MQFTSHGLIPSHQALHDMCKVYTVMCIFEICCHRNCFLCVLKSLMYIVCSIVPSCFWRTVASILSIYWGGKITYGRVPCGVTEGMFMGVSQVVWQKVCLWVYPKCPGIVSVDQKWTICQTGQTFTKQILCHDTIYINNVKTRKWVIRWCLLCKETNTYKTWENFYKWRDEVSSVWVKKSTAVGHISLQNLF